MSEDDTQSSETKKNFVRWLSQEEDSQGKSPNDLLSQKMPTSKGPSPLETMQAVHLTQQVREASQQLTELNKQQSGYIGKLELSAQKQAEIESKLEAVNKGLLSAHEAFSKKIHETVDSIENDLRETVASLEAAFTEQQAIRQPVELWKAKQKEHASARRLSLGLFILGLLAAAGAVVGLIYFLATQAEYVETLLAPVGCDPADKASNCSGFSLKGTLLAAGGLTLFTLLLWFVRLQMKLYLAERHLALDARERQAFAQSYIGLVREGDVSEEAREQRALVYAALFRPSSDGTVKEEGGLDPSVAAAVSKILMR